MSYINFGIKNLESPLDDNIIQAYEQGFVMTRVSPGHMEKIRSIRIDLKKFVPSSENRRILGKFNHKIIKEEIPLANYDWHIHKIGKDFYDTKFGIDTFSANKIKEILTERQNFNILLKYEDIEIDGYCICKTSQNKDLKIIHYSYPFYKIEKINKNFGIFMMTLAIQTFQEEGFDYIYLGSCHSEESKYKLQFTGLEWFDEKSNTWNTDIENLKQRLKE